MAATPHQSPQTALMMLDAAAQAARSGFACMFSSSDEYEAALIATRRAEGRYGSSSSYWPVAMLIGCGLAMVGAFLMMF